MIFPSFVKLCYDCCLRVISSTFVVAVFRCRCCCCFCCHCRLWFVLVVSSCHCCCHCRCSSHFKLCYDCCILPRVTSSSFVVVVCCCCCCGYCYRFSLLFVVVIVVIVCHRFFPLSLQLSSQIAAQFSGLPHHPQLLCDNCCLRP